MKIELTRRYRGMLTDEEPIEPGTYHDTDLPTGLAQYLVDNGHAGLLSESTETIPQETAPEGNERDLLEAQYQVLYGKAPHPNTKDDTLRQRIEEALADDTTNTDD